MLIVDEETCTVLCKSLVGQIMIIATFIWTVWQEIRHQRDKNKVKVII